MARLRVPAFLTDTLYRLKTKPAVMVVRKDARFSYYPTADAAWCVLMAGSERDHIVGIHRNVRIPRWHQFGQWRAA